MLSHPSSNAGLVLKFLIPVQVPKSGADASALFCTAWNSPGHSTALAFRGVDWELSITFEVQLRKERMEAKRNVCKTHRP